MYDRRLHAYTAIIIIASILVTPFLSMATAQPNARFSLAEWESSDVESCKLYNHSDTSYVDETTDANDADPSDVPLIEHYSETPEVNDAVYIGSSAPIPALMFDISTQGVGSWVITWEYYNGSSWNSLEDVDDDTNGFLTEYGDGLCVTWTMPSDWAETTVDGNTYYWVRARVSTFVTVSFQPKGDQIYLLSYVIGWCKVYNHDDTSYVDETTDANDADPSDVPLLQPPAAPPQVNDAIYIGSSAPIPALAFDISTQGVGSWVITWEYYNGSSWNSLEDVEDDTNGFLTEYGDGLYVMWTMPSDWAETTVDGNTYYWVRARVSTFAAMGFQPKGDQIYRLSSAPLSEGEQWAFDSAFIFLGLIMIPASALYLVRGGKDGLSSDKLFYALIVFFMGCGFFIGGIMP